MGSSRVNRELPLAGAMGDASLQGGGGRAFALAAMSGCAIGVAAVTLGLVVLAMGRHLPADVKPRERAMSTAFGILFIGPGALYVLLSVWVARRRRWAVGLLMLLALLDLTLLGALFMSAVGQAGALLLCGVVGLFVVALAVLVALLARAWEGLKGKTKLGPGVGR